VENILVIFQSMYEVGRWPLSLYPGWLSAILTFLVPIVFATTVPAQVLAAKLTWPALAGAWALSAAFAVASRLMWKAGLRRYSGASS
jgi:ABC-2 type transport system permease protein